MLKNVRSIEDDKSKPAFCANARWYGYGYPSLKERTSRLAGFYATPRRAAKNGSPRFGVHEALQCAARLSELQLSLSLLPASRHAIAWASGRRHVHVPLGPSRLAMTFSSVLARNSVRMAIALPLAASSISVFATGPSARSWGTPTSTFSQRQKKVTFSKVTAPLWLRVLPLPLADATAGRLIASGVIPSAAAALRICGGFISGAASAICFSRSRSCLGFRELDRRQLHVLPHHEIHHRDRHIIHAGPVHQSPLRRATAADTDQGLHRVAR